MLRQLTYIEQEGVAVSLASVHCIEETSSTTDSSYDVYLLQSFRCCDKSFFASWKPTARSIDCATDNALVDIDDNLASSEKFDILSCKVLPPQLLRLQVVMDSDGLDLSK